MPENKVVAVHQIDAALLNIAKDKIEFILDEVGDTLGQTGVPPVTPGHVLEIEIRVVPEP